jgi:hypothetical protein
MLKALGQFPSTSGTRKLAVEVTGYVIIWKYSNNCLKTITTTTPVTLAE